MSERDEFPPIPTPGAWSSCGSRRNPDDSDGTALDSDDYQTGSDGTRNRADTPRSPSDDLAYPDYRPSMAEAAASKARTEERRAPALWMPGAEEIDGDPEPADATDFGTDGPEREYKSRQLGLRLRPKHWERLLECARLYGVRPTTMARMMVVRGTNAIHEAELRARARELKEFGSE